MSNLHKVNNKLSPMQM